MGSEGDLTLPWPAYENFFECTEKTPTNLKAKCKLCLPKIKILSCHTTASSNLRKHILNVHPLRVKELDETVVNMRKRKNPSEDNNKSKQMKLDHFTATSLIPTQDTVDKFIINFVINSLQPFSICDNTSKGGRSFNSLVTGLQPSRTVMCSKTLKLRLMSKLDATKDNIVQEMMKVPYVSVTTDCWSAAKRSYIGVTAHWINPFSFERHHAALACQRLTGHHTFDVLASAMERIFENYQIQNKITGVTTDNGSNFVKAFRLFGENLESEESSGEVEFVEINDILGDGDDIDIADSVESSVAVLPILPPHHRCASHTLNLIATKDAEKALQVQSFKKLFRQTMAKCRGLWNRQNTSTVAADVIKEALGFYLRVPNSMFDACSQIKIIITTKTNSANTTNNDSGLDKMHSVMKPLATALDLLQRQDNMYMGYLLPVLYQTVSTLRELKNLQLQYCMPLICSLIDGILLRFQPVWWKRSFVISSCVHPKFKLDWISTDKKSEAYNWVIDELKTFHSEVEPGSAASPNTSIEEAPAEDTFFKFPTSRECSSDEDHLKILYTFLKNKSRQLQLLSQFRCIEDVFVKYNTSIPSSAPVERMFSVAGDVFTNKRHALADDNFECQLLLNLNSEYMPLV